MIRCLLLAALVASPAFAQDLQLPTPSPLASASQQVGVNTITVTYSSPGKKGRTIFGELVPFDALWRTGANAATTLELSAGATIGGTKVPAGKYSLFTIPGKDEWTVIVNMNANQGGTRSYDKKLDVVRTKVKPTAGEARERLTFLFSETTDAGTNLDLVWAGTQVRLPITVDTAAQAKTNIAGFSKASAGGLASAARYHADQKDYDGAIKLIDASIAIDEGWFNTWLKADFLAKKGQYKAAYPLAERAHALGMKAEYFFFKDQVEAALKDWKGKK